MRRCGIEHTLASGGQSYFVRAYISFEPSLLGFPGLLKVHDQIELALFPRGFDLQFEFVDSQGLWLIWAQGNLPNLDRRNLKIDKHALKLRKVARETVCGIPFELNA